MNQAISAIKFLYRRVLHRPEVVQSLPRPRGKHSLPVVLSREEVVRLFLAVDNPKHRIILMVVYAAGLRVSEVVRLWVNDIDEDRRQTSLRFVQIAFGDFGNPKNVTATSRKNTSRNPQR